MNSSEGRHYKLRLADREKEFTQYLATLLAEIDETPRGPHDPQTKVDPSEAVTHSQEQPRPQGEENHTASQECSEVEAVRDSGCSLQAQGCLRLPFQVLLFELCDLTLGVPLAALRGVLQLNESLSRLPGQPAWHLGVMSHHSQKLVVVDTTRLIMPERTDQRSGERDILGSYLLLIGEGDYGLLIDKIKTTKRLERGDVHWRKCRERTPWLGGVILGELSVLLNVDALLRMIR